MDYCIDTSLHHLIISTQLGSVFTLFKYLERQAGTNSVDPDQTLQEMTFDQGHTVCHSSNLVLDISTASEMDIFKFKDKYGKKLTNFSLEMPKRVIDKQWRSRSDATKCSI